MISLLYVSDLVGILLKIIEINRTLPLNIIGNTVISVGELANTILLLTKSKSKIIYISKNTGSKQSIIGKIEKYSFTEKFTLKQGLLNTIRGQKER